jgi:hypothetical protein
VSWANDTQNEAGRLWRRPAFVFCVALYQLPPERAGFIFEKQSLQ